MKKTLLAATLVAILLATGCGGGEPAKNEGAVPKADAATTVQKTDGKTSIKKVSIDYGPLQDMEVVERGGHFYLKSTGERLYSRDTKGETLRNEAKIQSTGEPLHRFRQ